MSKFIWILWLILPISAWANPWEGTFDDHTRYSVCFTPNGHCTDMIVEAIDRAKTSIKVQAYSFTSAPIIHALIAAKQRGVQLDILLDKSNVNQPYSGVHDLEMNEVPFLVDYQPAIAHNKVMIIDDHVVITGSFNFTKNAQARNAENALIIDSPELASFYEKNFNLRKQVSVSVAEYRMNYTPKHHRRHRHA